MTAQEHLSGYGVSMEVARDYLMNNLDSLSAVYNTCQTYGVNNDMIAEILTDDFPGLNGSVVSNFFDSNGFNGSSLGFNVTPVDNVIDGEYTGSYNGDQYGNFSFTVADTTVSGTWYSPVWDEYGYVSGSVDNETGSVSLTSRDEDGVPISFTGIITDDSASGTWSMPYYGDGTFNTNLV